MTDSSVILILVMVANAILGFIVLFSQTDIKIRFSFASIAFGISLWALTNNLFLLLPIQYIGLWARVSDASALLIVFSLIFFVHVFPKGTLSRRVSFLFIGTGLIMIIASLIPNVFIEGVYEVRNGREIVRNYPYVIIFSLVVAGLFIWSFLILYLKMLRSVRVEKIQILLILCGALAAALVGVVTNLVLPLIGNYSLVWLGPIMTTIFLAMSVYAITRHQLFNTRVILSEILVSSIFLGTLYLVLRFPWPPFIYYQLAFLLLVAVIGFLFLRSVMKEVHQREHIEQLAKELEATNEQLKEMDKIKSEFLNIASHQLYTPMTAIRGYVSMMIEGEFGRIPKKQQPVIDILLQASDRLIDLIRDLLDVSRIEDGRLQLSLESLDLVDMAENLITELQPNADKKNLDLRLEKSKEKMPHVVADAQRIRQVLLNIIDNAIKYTDKGSIIVHLAKDGDYLVFSVQDTGMGMSAKEINVLFTKFTRVGGVNKYRTEGSGLGLYVARQITQEHNGDIWAESEGMKKGSTFFLKLPIEGTPKALKAGEKVNVEIKKAGEVGKKEKKNKKQSSDTKKK